MFIQHQEALKKEYYQKMLQTVGSLSKLFSESEEPYLFYRVAENLFCKSFGAENLSRSDASADASLNGIGFGLKTFLHRNGRSMEKVAEFNTDSASFRDLNTDEKIKEIARLRNDRIETTKRTYGLTEIIYHCVTRSNGKMSVFESPMRTIDLATVEITYEDDKTIRFKDKFDEYSFNISKSTLFKRFLGEESLLDFPVTIVGDPFEALEQMAEAPTRELKEILSIPAEQHKYVNLPLYSTKGGPEDKSVPEKSGLNQWNAAGRPRNSDEVYIPVPAWIHKKFPSFFPARDKLFTLHLPDKKKLSAKICQDGGKALMTNPNEALGHWILRDVLALTERELLTYKKLEDLGIDAVAVYKIDDENYRIDFAKLGSYEEFEESYNV